MRVLVVEDEVRLAASLRLGLEAEGFAVDVAPDGGEALWYAREHDYDAILLDIMLPIVNGYEVCATLRAEQNWTPILMLTAKDGAVDQVEALDTGADDYVTKPFSFDVLLARLRSLLRRRGHERPVKLLVGDLEGLGYVHRPQQPPPRGTRQRHPNKPNETDPLHRKLTSSRDQRGIISSRARAGAGCSCSLTPSDGPVDRRELARLCKISCVAGEL